MTPALKYLALGMVLLLGLTGCSGIRNDFQEKKAFRLTASPKAAESRTQNLGKGLVVKHFSISPEFEAATFMLRVGPNQFGSDFYHNYMVPPARMLTDVIAEALYASEFFSPVSPNAVTDIDYQLWGKIIDLYADIRDKTAPKAVVSIRVVLEKNTGKTFIPVLHKTYSANILLTEISHSAYVTGLNQGLTQILDNFFADLAQAGLPAEK